MPRTGKVKNLPSVFFAVLLVAMNFLIVTPCLADNSINEVSASERQKILETFKTLHKDMHSIFALVSQEKQIAALKKKVVVQGTVTMAKPNRLKWDVIKPERSVTVIDGETMTVYHPDIKEAQVYDLSDQLIARNAMSFFSTAMSGNLAEMEERFTVSIFRTDGEVVFRLVPISKIVRRYLAAVVIHYDEKSALPKGFEMSTPKGDKTITRIAGIKVNPELDPGTFQLTMPLDVWITNKVEPKNN
ncbi:MAG TPA: outer membrane lipoprotein carrier protein LolA [Dissulfurispiraceae bacterium]|nr:outer membrane lipoprotein carrier protein LolA [Dissulfurispiraceae bacterium]